MLLDSTNKIILQTLADSTNNLHILDRNAYQENPTFCDKISIKRIPFPHHTCWYSSETVTKKFNSVVVSLQGSLPRPPSVLSYLKDRKDEAIPADILETAVKETVQKQIEVF